MNGTKYKNTLTERRRGFGQVALLLVISVGSVTVRAASVEEVIVTATKRAQSLQEIPASLSVISGEDLEARGAVEFFDYAISIPNLSFGATSDGVLSGRGISIRGIEGVNTTGFYIDDTPVTETINPRILDVERIEVLRGPSGTLYGARSLGGAIRQITRKADPEAFSGRAKTSFSDTGEAGDLNYLAAGRVNVPLGERAAVLISALYEKQAGLFDRVVGTIADPVGAPATLAGPADFVNENVDDEDTFAAQITLTIQPADKLTIEPRLIYQKTELDGFPLADNDPENFDQNRDFDTAEGGEDEWSLYSLNLSYEIEAGAFTSATSYFDRETFEFEGSGSFVNFLQLAALGVTPANYSPVTSPIFQRLDFESFTQELRFVSTFDGNVNFVAGAFYQNTDDDEDFVPRNLAPGLGDNLLASGSPVAVFGDLIFTAERPSTIEESGLYGEVTYDLNERLAVILGARYFDTEFSFTNTQAGLAAGVPLADDAPLSGVAPIADATQRENGFNFKGALEYGVTEKLLIYGLVAEGFRIGGANGPLPAALGCPAIDVTGGFESDDLISYEAGIKAGVSDNTRINTSVFYIDFENIQQKIQLGCGFQFIDNFGAARSRGVEIEFLTQVIEGLTLGVNIGYTDAKFTETVQVFDTSGTLAFSIDSGDSLQQVPEWTASLSADYLAPALVAGYDFFVRADASYVDESESRVNSSSMPRVRDSYEQVNLRLGLRNEKYALTLFVRNLTDEIANLSDNRSLAAETPGRPRFVISRPRTIGVELAVNF